MKVFGLEWVFEPLADSPLFFTKRMFGGLAGYLGDRIVLCLMEDPGDCTYRGKTYGFEIWNGVLVPTDREFHADLIREFPSLRSHPVLGKWLYLPMEVEDFEETVSRVVERIRSGDPRFGVLSGQSRKTRKKRA